MKTPEEMAEEWSRTPRPNQDVDEYQISWDFVCEWEKESFVAGYQAAKDTYKDAIETYEDVAKQMLEEAVRIMSPKDQLADADKVMNSPEKPDGWISVKERLPEDGVGWTTVYGCILSRWAVQPGFYTKDSGVWVSRFVFQDEDYHNYLPFESVTHWMPLPEAPKGEG